ncbi:HAD hydrolase-like protein [Acidobacteria bacterium AH-259-G07]|nr:HAD hydrolase-like protein [Acidobacteria bacterium AH-259-G07]
MRFVLFDVDGTLLLTGGAGTRALKSALEQTYALPNGISGVRPGGKTDPQIVREVLQRYGGENRFTEENLSFLFPIYLSFLREELTASHNFLVLPGVRELVCTLSRKQDFLLGLATGNLEQGAQMKLERAGLSSFFLFGGYGSDAEDRTDLIRVAIERGHERIAPVRPECVFIVGDTPRDIVHGKEARAQTVAVASGSYSLDALKAYKPDFAVASLDPIEPIVEFLES